MKKFTAVLLAVMLIMVSFVTAFAADVFTCPVCSRKYEKIDEYNACIDKHADVPDASTQTIHKCATCGKMFADLKAYNECVDSHFNNVNYHYDKYVGLTIPQLLAELVEIFNKTGTVETVQYLMDKLFELTEKTIDEKTFADTISDLEAKINDLDLEEKYSSELKDIIDKLKDKANCEIANDKKTETEVTEAEPPAETGSSAGVGIVVFAAVSTALAAAYVTVSKKRK